MKSTDTLQIITTLYEARGALYTIANDTNLVNSTLNRIELSLSKLLKELNEAEKLDTKTTNKTNSD